MGIVLAPVLFIGLGFLLDELSRRVTHLAIAWWTPVFEWRRRRKGEARAISLQQTASIAGRTLAWLALLCIVILMSQTVWRGVATSFSIVPKDFARATLPAYELEDAGAAVKWLEPQLNADDLVVVTHINWMFSCRTVSPMLAQVAEGKSKNPIYYDKLIERLIYPCKMSDARFAVIHSATPGLVAVYGLEETIRPVFDEWIRVKRLGRVSVYANPEHPRNSNINRPPDPSE